MRYQRREYFSEMMRQPPDSVIVRPVGRFNVNRWLILEELAPQSIQEGWSPQLMRQLGGSPLTKRRGHGSADDLPGPGAMICHELSVSVFRLFGKALIP